MTSTHSHVGVKRSFLQKDRKRPTPWRLRLVSRPWWNGRDVHWAQLQTGQKTELEKATTTPSPAQHLLYTDGIKSCFCFLYQPYLLLSPTPEAQQCLTWTWQQLCSASGHAESITALTGLVSVLCISHWSPYRIHRPSTLPCGTWLTRCCQSCMV